jgi:hypothetical protein
MGDRLDAVTMAVGVGGGFKVEWDERGDELDGLRGCDMDRGGLSEPEEAGDTRGGSMGRLASHWPSAWPSWEEEEGGKTTE